MSLNYHTQSLSSGEFCLIFTLVGVKLLAKASFSGELANVSHACYRGEGTILENL